MNTLIRNIERLIFIAALLLPVSLWATITGTSTACAGLSVTYIYSTSPPVTTISWTVTGGVAGTDYTIATSGLTAIITWLRAGSYHVQAGTDSYAVTVTSPPDPAITPSANVGCLLINKSNTWYLQYDNTCDRVCENSTVTYQTALHTGSTYIWEEVGATAATPAGASCSVQWGPAAGITQVKVTETNSSGCSAIATLCVRGVNSPNAVIGSTTPIIGGTIHICHSVAVLFYDLSTIVSTTYPPSRIESYYWDFGDGTSSASQNPPPHTYASNGTYTVTLHVTSECGCEDVTTVTVDVSDIGPPLFCPTTKCHDDTATYYTTASCSTYDWHITNGTFVPTPSPTDNSVHVVWGNGNSGSGEISLSTPSCSGICPTATIATIPILPSSPVITGPTQLCANQLYYFSAPMIPSTTYTWTLSTGAGTVFIQDYQTQIMLNPGITTCTLTVVMENTFYHCTGTSSIILTVKQPVDISCPDGNTFCQGTSHSFSANGNIGPGYNTLHWHVEDASGNTVAGTSYVGATYTLAYSMAPGDYVVVAEDATGILCSPRVINPIVVNGSPAALTSINPVTCVCPGQMYNYFATATDPALQLQWTANGAAGGTTTELGNAPSFQWTATGALSLDVVQIGANGCPSPVFSTAINRCTLPPTGAITNATGGTASSAPCENTTVSYRAPVLDGDSYIWSITPPTAGTVLTGSSTNTVSVAWFTKPTGATSVTLSVIVIKCSATQAYTQSISLAATPLPTITAGNLCNNAALTFTTPSTGITSYAWHMDGAVPTLSTTSSLSISTTAVTATNIAIAVTVVYGCLGNSVTVSNSGNFTVKQGPSVSVDPWGGAHSCPVGTNVTLTATPTNTISPISYLWSNSATTQSISSHTVGPYSVTVTSSNSCSASASGSIDNACGGGCTTWAAGTAPSFTVGTPSCNSVAFSGTWVTTGSPVVTWDFGDPGSSSYSGTLNNPTHIFSRSGVFNVTLSVAYPGYCNIMIIHTVTIGTSINFNYGVTCTTSGINNDVVTITNLSTTSGSPSYQWSITPNTVTGVASGNTYSITPTSSTPASVTVLLKDLTSTCQLSKTVTLGYIPTPGITSPGSYSQCADNTITLTANNVSSSISILQWRWPSNDLMTTGASAIFTLSGSAAITLDAVDIHGCHHTASSGTFTQQPNNFIASVSSSPLGSVCVSSASPITLSAVTTPAFAPPVHTPLSYGWSNGPTTSTDLVTVNNNYIVTITDNYGCKQNATGGASFISVPTPPIDGPLTACVGDQMLFTTRPYAVSGYSYQWSNNASTPTTGGSTYSYTAANIGTTTVTSTTNVSLVYTSGGLSCASVPASMNTIISAPLPSPTVSMSGNKCVDAGPVPLTMTPTAITNCSWSDGETGNPISVYSGGIYSVFYLDGNGCKSPAATVTVKPGLGLERLIMQCLHYCAGSSPGPIITMPNDPNDTYTWHPGSPTGTPTSSGYQLPITGSGTYYLHITNADGCQVNGGPVYIAQDACSRCCKNGVFQIQSISLTSASPCTWKYTLSYSNPAMVAGENATISLIDGSNVSHTVNSTDVSAGKITFNGTVTGSTSTSQMCFDLLYTKADGTKCSQEVCTFVSCP